MASAVEAWRGQVILFVVTLAAYAVAVASPFQFDDAVAIVGDPSVHSLGAALRSVGKSLRPVLDVSYAASWAMADGATWPFHICNLLLHLLNVQLVVGLADAALGGLQRASWRGPIAAPQTRGATLTGALFALHPLQTEAVTYISGRSSLLAASFLLLALTCYVAFARAPRRWGYYVASIVAFTLAVFTKELSVVFPLMLFTWEWFIERTRGRVLLARLGPWCLVGLLSMVVLVSNERYFRLLLSVVGQRSMGRALELQTAGVAYLASQVTLLRYPCIDPGLGFGVEMGWWSWAGLAVLLSLLAGCVLVANRYGGPGAPRLTAFGVTFFLLQVFVPYVFLPRADVINERHAYLGNFGLFLVLGVTWRTLESRVAHWCGNGRGGTGFQSLGFAKWFTSALLLGLGTLTVKRNLDYRSEVNLWRATVSCAPKNPRAHNNLGIAYEGAGQLLQARAAYARAIALEPRYAAARNNFVRATHKKPTSNSPIEVAPNPPGE